MCKKNISNFKKNVTQNLVKIRGKVNDQLVINNNDKYEKNSEETPRCE